MIGLNTQITSNFTLENKRINKANASTATVYGLLNMVCLLVPSIKMVTLLDLRFRLLMTDLKSMNEKRILININISFHIISFYIF